MTRTITLADISPAPVLSSGKFLTDTSSSKADKSEDASSFAAILEDAGSAGNKGPMLDECNEQQTSHRKTDRATTSGDVAPSPTPPLVPVLVETGKDGLTRSGAVLTAISSPNGPSFSASGSPGEPDAVSNPSPLSQSHSDQRETESSFATCSADEETLTPAVLAASTQRTGITSVPASGLDRVRGVQPDSAERQSAQSALGSSATADLSSAPRLSWDDSVVHAPATARDEVGDRPGRDAAQAERVAPSAAESSAAGSPFAGTASLCSSTLTTTYGEFSAQLHRAGIASAPNPADSGFLARNNALSAALSKPLREGNGVYSVTVRLNPPSLGHLEAVVKVDGSDVSVTIVAHNPEGHLAIARHLDELRQFLSADGGGVQLSLSDGGGKGRQQDNTQAPTPSDDQAEPTDSVVLTLSPAQGSKSLHVIL